MARRFRCGRRARAWRVAVAALLVAATAGTARAQEPSLAQVAEAARLRSLEQRAAERLATLQREADTLAGRQRGLIDRLRALELKRDIAVVEAERAGAAVGAAEADLARIEARRATIERAMAARRPDIQARLAALYRSGTAGDLRRWLMAETLAEAASAERLLAAVTARDRREFAAFAALRADLAAQEDALRRQREALAAHRAATAAAREGAVRAAAEHEALIRQVDRQRDLAAQLAAELQAARTSLQQQIEGLAAERAAGPALPMAPFRGTLPWPADGRVIASFGRRPSSRFGTAVPAPGIEIGAPVGSPVRAIHDGRVAFAGEFPGLGRIVMLDHGRGSFSLYGYLDALDVPRGATVERGARIGQSGRAPAGHAAVYFELRVDARPVNPLEWLHR